MRIRQPIDRAGAVIVLCGVMAATIVAPHTVAQQADELASTPPSAPIQPAPTTPAVFGPWAQAYDQDGPMTADQTKALIKRFAEFVYASHLKRDEKSDQRGMIYEYLNTEKLGKLGQFVQGRGLWRSQRRFSR